MPGSNPCARRSAFLSRRDGYNAGSSSNAIERQEENGLSRAAKPQPRIKGYSADERTVIGALVGVSVQVHLLRGIRRRSFRASILHR